MGKVAFFDVDGTLANGYYMFDFPIALSKANLFSTKGLEGIKRVFIGYKSGEISYYDLGVELGTSFAEGVKGQKPEDIKEEAIKFLSLHPERIHSFTRDLIELVKTRGLEPVIVSGSPIEIIQPFGESVGVKDIFATTSEIIGGIYSGKVVDNTILGEVKSRLIGAYVKQNSINPLLCAGFGDTEQDLSFLDIVGYPVAIKPNDELRKYSISKEWLICDRENQVISQVNQYLQLRPKNISSL